jgi:hypothetical protein
MRKETDHSECAKKIELLLRTREEDFRELRHQLAEMQRLLSTRLEAHTQRIAVIEASLARAREARLAV